MKEKEEQENPGCGDACLCTVSAHYVEALRLAWVRGHQRRRSLASRKRTPVTEEIGRVAGRLISSIFEVRTARYLRPLRVYGCIVVGE